MRGLELNTAVIHEHLFSEFNAFQMELEAGLQDRRQGMRASFLQFAITFLHELVPAELMKEIAKFILVAKEADHYDSFGWINLLPLEVAMFDYSGVSSMLTQAVGNLAHHSSGTRDRVHNALALSADRVDADNPYMISCIERSLSELTLDIGHIALFAAAKGEPQAKTRQLEEWLASMEPGAWGAREMRTLAGGGYIANPFAPWTRLVERYSLMRAFAAAESIPIQLVARRPSMALQPGRANVEASLAAAEVINRIDAHPLTGQFVQIIQNNVHCDVTRYTQTWRTQ